MGLANIIWENTTNIIKMHKLIDISRGNWISKDKTVKGLQKK